MAKSHKQHTFSTADACCGVLFGIKRSRRFEFGFRRLARWQFVGAAFDDIFITPEMVENTRE